MDSLHEEKEKVQVCVRIRPLQAQEIISGERLSWVASSDSTTLILSEESSGPRPGFATARQQSPVPNAFSVSSSTAGGLSAASQSFNYDRVFSQSTSSEDVYAHSSRQLVKSAMEGYNCTIFVYGQTGSGKTHTMRSLMSQATKDIFNHISATPNRVFVVRLRAMEIYNEIVKDLLPSKVTEGAEVSGTSAFGTGTSSHDTASGLKVCEDPEHGTTVQGLTEYFVDSAQHLEQLLKTVESQRHVRDTKMNQSSSRSHQIVRLYVDSRQPDDAETLEAPMTMSTISFVDLAGSERMSQAAGTEDVGKEKLRQIEASNINKSLLTLGDVIRALGEQAGRKHVRYRDSKLTRILQPSLSGNSRMAILCTISPASGAVDQSIVALRFATAAKRVVMRPVLNKIGDDKAIIKHMMAEIEMLKAQLTTNAPQADSSQTDQLSAALSMKEAQVQEAAEEKDRLQRRLAGLENFVLRGHAPGQMKKQRRNSLNGVLEASVDSPANLARLASATPVPRLLAYGRLPSNHTPGSTPGVRASWNPNSDYKPSQSLAVSDHGSGSRKSTTTAVGAVGGSKLLLDYFLSPSVRKAASRASQSLAVQREGSRGSIKSAVPRLNLSGPEISDSQGSVVCTLAISHAAVRIDIDKLVLPTGPQVEEALAALQAEVRCLKHGSDSMSSLPSAPAAAGGSSAAGAAASGASKDLDAAAPTVAKSMTEVAVEDVIQRMRLELRRLEGSDEAQSGGADCDREVEDPSGQDELVAAMKLELSRLESAQASKAKAAQALESLQRKMEEPALADDDELKEEVEASMPDWLHDMLGDSRAGDVSADSQHALPPPLRTNSVTSVNMQARTRSERDLSSSDPFLLGTSALLPSMALATAGLQEGGGTFTPGEDSNGQDGEAVAGTMDEEYCAVDVPQQLYAHSPSVSATSGAEKGSDTMRQGGKKGGMSASMGHTGRTPPRHAKQPPLKRSSLSTSDCADSKEFKLRSSETADIRTSHIDQDLEVPCTLAEPEFGSLYRAGSSSISGQGSFQRWDTGRVRDVLRSQKDALSSWYRTELRRVHTSFKASAEKDIQNLKEAMEQYREQIERLETQKKFILKHGLQLEARLEEEEQQQAELKAQLSKALAERNEAKAAAKAAVAIAHTQSEAATAARQAAAHRDNDSLDMAPHDQFTLPPYIDQADDGWEADDTPETLMPRILESWEELFTPLIYRSRFFLNFREKEVFYCDLEHRRLQYRCNLAKAAEGPHGERCKELDRAARALDWERKSLANQLKWVYNEGQRETLFQEWSINSDSKERKLQLVNKLWQPARLAMPNGAQCSAELVVALSGTGDATSQFMELVFGGTAGAMPKSVGKSIGSVVGGLARIVTLPRSRGGPAPGAQQQQQQYGGAGGMRQSSSSNMSSALAAPSVGGVTPRTSSIVSKLMNRSFLTKRMNGGGAVAASEGY